MSWPISKAHWSSRTKQCLNLVAMPSPKLVFHNGGIWSNLLTGHRPTIGEVFQIFLYKWVEWSTFSDRDFFFVCLCCLKYLIAFSAIHEKQMDESFLIGWEVQKRDSIFDFPPLEGAVCSGFTASTTALQSTEEQHIQGHGTSLSLSPSYIGFFEQNPAPALLHSVINGHIQHHYSRQWH